MDSQQGDDCDKCVQHAINLLVIKLEYGYYAQMFSDNDVYVLVVAFHQLVF